MATAKPNPSYQPNRRKRRVLPVIGLAALALLAWSWPALMGQATAGAAYGARIACSCRFVAGRALSNCRDDLETGMSLVTLSEDAEAKSVTARFPLLSAQTARLQPGAGCVLERWED